MIKLHRTERGLWTQQQAPVSDIVETFWVFEKDFKVCKFGCCGELAEGAIELADERVEIYTDLIPYYISKKLVTTCDRSCTPKRWTNQPLACLAVSPEDIIKYDPSSNWCYTVRAGAQLTEVKEKEMKTIEELIRYTEENGRVTLKTTEIDAGKCQALARGDFSKTSGSWNSYPESGYIEMIYHAPKVKEWKTDQLVLQVDDIIAKRNNGSAEGDKLCWDLLKIAEAHRKLGYPKEITIKQFLEVQDQDGNQYAGDWWYSIRCVLDAEEEAPDNSDQDRISLEIFLKECLNTEEGYNFVKDLQTN